MRLRTPDGRWSVEQRQYASAATGRGGNRRSAGPGDGTVLVVTGINGSHAGDCRTVAEVAALLGPAFAELVPA